MLKGKSFIIVMALLFALTLVAGGVLAAAEDIAVIVKTNSSSYWQVVNKGAQAAAKELGIKITYDGPAAETDINGQVSMVENAINRQVKGIVLAPCDPKGLVKVAERAKAQKIALIGIDSALDTRCDSFLTTNNVAAGKKAAQELIKRAGTTGKVALMLYVAGAGSCVDRAKGFTDEIKARTKMTIVGPYYSESDSAKALNQMTDVLASNPDLKAVFAANEPTAIGVAKAIDESGKAGKLVAIGFDGAPILQQYVEKGVLQGIMVQSPYNMGYLGVKAAWDKMKGKKIKAFIDTGVFGVTTQNIKTDEAQKALGNK
ncbi:monosaccharide ABC transporter substrate-binding protein (CUT2 family) [Hydrogenispora ethanolica]|jgi:ribose transport system substrate-binding protein|uniref:Monosaccharide ABC transporter substrate-binding protein (CUT2 family) n=1 Tax=Hydrogenispora ethanolica TaxID=1082276 RepID=A0A4R1S9W6_HYDET|nr:ABC transporter substrate-binding protein [Hydrogenispora ethanolica]TCL76285.1 monosaccharide ABC transporter substrate-binding protein (CUT2 family) [Hydrogenispora ethanolica]